jgi:CpeT protein
MASRLIFSTLFCSFLVASCAVSKKSKGDTDLVQLKQYMAGNFNSAAQAARDTNYFDISLRMYPIWPKREGHWLYVEQAVTTNQGKPYRQRVYKLEKRDDQTFVSQVYTIKAEKDFVNAWKTPEKFEALTLDGIDLKAGCEVVLKKEGKLFSGATGDKTCPSELRGAKYATSKVTIHADKIVSWDQGFNAEGKQVWGATLGGYEFIKG